MSEQLLDVRGAARLVLRSWRLAAVFVVAALLAAGGYVWSSLPRYQASALVLLPTTSAIPGTTSANSVATDAKIATSAAVLAPAGQTADPTASLSQLESWVKASPEATGVLEVFATAPTRVLAERLANAVATDLVQFVTTSGTKTSTNVVTGLDSEESQLQKQLAGVEDQVTAARKQLAAEGSSSPAGKQETVTLANLTSQETEIAQQLSTVKSQISSAETGQASANQGTEVIQRARSAMPPSALSLGLPFVAALVAGALVGSMVVLARNRTHPRVRTREAVARALGAPVVLSLNVVEHEVLGDWVALFEHHEPEPLELWSVLKALRELGLTASRLDLVVLAFGDDTKGVAQAVHLAVSAAAAGVSTGFSLLAPDGAQRSLQALCGSYVRDGRNPRQGLLMQDGQPASTRAGVELSLTVALADVADPSALVSLCPPGIYVASISAGFATTKELARLGVAASEAGSPIVAVCVANPDPRDETVGRFKAPGRTTPPTNNRRLVVPHGGGVTVERSR